MARNYAAVPHEYLKEMEALSDAEFGRLIRALLKYSSDGEAMALTGNERFFANRVMIHEQRHQKSYDDTSAVRRAAGKLGGRPRKDSQEEKANETKKTYNNTKTKTNNKTNNDTLPSNDGESNNSARARFVPPTLTEVAEYVAYRGSNVDPQYFIDFYTAKGWLVGKNPMKDWKAACRNAESWDRWKNKETPAESSTGTGNIFLEMLNEGRAEQ